MRDTDTHTDDQWHAHMAAIRCVIQDWETGKISIDEKRRRIAAENKRYYPEPVRSAGSNEFITAVPRSHEWSAAQ